MVFVPKSKLHLEGIILKLLVANFCCFHPAIKKTPDDQLRQPYHECTCLDRSALRQHLSGACTFSFFVIKSDLFFSSLIASQQTVGMSYGVLILLNDRFEFLLDILIVVGLFLVSVLGICLIGFLTVFSKQSVIDVFIMISRDSFLILNSTYV